MGVLLLTIAMCLVVPPATLLAFTLAGGLLATVGLFAAGFAGAVLTVVGAVLVPLGIARFKLPADLH